MSGASVHPMSHPEDPAPEATMGDLLIQLRRMADAAEAQLDRCGERRGGGNAACGLLPNHRGYHVTLDGRDMWLDD